ncbi:hypothetical protein NW759_015501 [Fusarium solani]|nr:hypothetical protein NW759_015501 [Fusarium solani]
MCELVDTVNSFGDHTNDMQKNSAFWGILHNSHYQKWKNQDHGLLRIVNSSDPELIPSGPDTVSIPPPVKPSQWNLRAFCRSLSHHHTDHQVLHLDFEAMATNCGPRRRQWTVNNLIGPLILRIFKAAVENTSETIDPLEFLCKHLNKNVNLVPSPEDKGEVTPFDRLILLTQELGSAMVHVIGNSLDDYYKMFPSDPESPPSDWENYACNMTDSCTPRPLMLILNGLDVLEPSPELGRLVYCISQLHEYINQGRDCKLLVTHKNRSDLDGLLKSFHCLKDNEYRDCLRSLQTDKPRVSRLPRDIDQRHPDTLKWLCDNKKYQDWQRANQRKSLLLLSGKPACGKSVFSRFVLEDLKPGSDDVVASFFFLNVDPNCSAANDQRDMLQALLYGILEGAPGLFPYFQSTYLRLKSEKEGTHPIEWTQSALERVLAGVTSHPLPNTIWILVDGLDETAPGESVGCVDCIGKFLPQEGSAISLKLLVATQPREPAMSQLKEYFDKPGEFWEITLQEENQDDIRAYIETFLHVDRLRRLKGGKMNLEGYRNTLFDSSRNVFLWVKLVERHIQKYTSGNKRATISDFEKFLKDIPKDIKGLYKKLFDRMMQEIVDQEDEDDRESQIQTVRAMLQVAIQTVSGPLLLDEFQDAYVVPSPEEWADFCIGDSRPENAKMIISKFTANFLEVHFNGEDERVQLLHQTAVEFLKEQKVRGVPLNEDAYDKQLSTMGSACIYYLEQVSSNSNHDLRAPLSLGLKEMESLATQINEYHLLPYALENFEGHVKVELHKDRLAVLVRHMRASSIELLLRKWIDSLAAKCGLSLNAGDAPNELKQVKFASNLLHVAVTKRLGTAVKVALLAGAEVDSQSTLYDSGERALCLLAMPPAELKTDDKTMRAEVAICRLLLAHGAQPDAQTRFEGTALHYAGKYMRLGVVRELLRQHADINPRDAKSMTPLHRAVIGHKPKNADPTELDARGHTPRSASKECVAALIQAGADLGAQEENGETPIHWAAGQMNRVKILELLIKGNTIGSTEQSVQAWRRAANLKCRNKQSTPLHWASGHGYLENIKLLIQHGADVSWADVTGRTALHWAAKWGYHAVLQELLEALDNTGEDKKSVVNSKETNGYTPLIWACRWGHVECAELLIDHGADVNLSQGGSEFGGTPISWAATYNYPKVIDLLVGKGAHMDETLLGWAAASGITDTFEHIRDVARHNNRELAVDGVGPFDKTPFMIAASYGRLKMVKYLCENFHIDVHRRDIDGNTALHFAARWKHLPMVEWLIEEAGLVINNANNHGKTALDCGLYYGAEEVNCYLIGKDGRRYVELRTMRSLL